MRIDDSVGSRWILIGALAAVSIGSFGASDRARAEGSDDMGPVVYSGASIAATGCTPGLGICQGLVNTTVLQVDIFFGDELIVWTGRGDVAVTSPMGVPVNGTDGDNLYASGELISPLPGVTGAYRLRPAENQFECPSSTSPIFCNVGMGTTNAIETFYRWDVTVLAGGTVPRPGRLWSRSWSFNAGNFGATQATTTSFYAVSDGGLPDADAIVELRLDGLAGFLYAVSANRVGPVSADLLSHGRSLSLFDATVTPEFAIYLSVPEIARFGRVTDNGIEVTELACTADEPGGAEAIPRTISFSTNVTGTGQIICDLDSPPDGAALTDDDDLVLITAVAPGMNAVTWDGRDRNGDPVLLDSLACIVRVTVGEFHYVATDIETSFPGLRTFEVEADLGRQALRMFWNDEAVQSGGAVMANGETSPATSPVNGLLSGMASDSAVPYSIENPAGNARAWGNFTSMSKGDVALLDTFTWLASAEVAETLTCAPDAGNPPTVVAPSDVTIEATGPLTPVALGTATATDPEDGTLTATPDTTGPFPLGTTTVTWSATDSQGNTATATQLVTVIDTTPPAITAPPDVTVNATGPLTAVDLQPGLASASDLVDGALTPTPDTTGPFPPGVTLVTWSATDNSGNTGSAVQSVEILSGACAGPWSYVGPNPFALPNSGEATELTYVQTFVSPLLAGPIKTELETTSWTSDGDYAAVLVNSANSYRLYVNVVSGQVLTSSSSSRKGKLQDISHVSRFVCVE